MEIAIIVFVIVVMAMAIMANHSKETYTKLMVITAAPLIEAHVNELKSREVKTIPRFVFTQTTYNMMVHCHNAHGIVVADSNFSRHILELIREQTLSAYDINEIEVGNHA